MPFNLLYIYLNLRQKKSLEGVVVSPITPSGHSSHLNIPKMTYPNEMNAKSATLSRDKGSNEISENNSPKYDSLCKVVRFRKTINYCVFSSIRLRLTTNSKERSVFVYPPVFLSPVRSLMF